MNLDLELQGALSDKSPHFGFADLTLFKELVHTHVAESAQKMAALGKTGPTIAAAQIERQQFDITLANIKHDIDVYKVWFTRNIDREAAVYFQELSHKQERKNQAKQCVRSLLDPTCSQWRISLCELKPAAECMQMVTAMRSRIMKLETLESKDQIMTLVVLNWAAPSSFTSQEQLSQANLAGALVNADGALGLMLSPVYFLKRGQLYKVEESANKLLSNANLNTDQRFVMPFSGRNDEREKRTRAESKRLYYKHKKRLKRTFLCFFFLQDAGATGALHVANERRRCQDSDYEVARRPTDEKVFG